MGAGHCINGIAITRPDVCPKYLHLYCDHHQQSVSVWVQGTAATALAGVYGALKVQGKEAHSLTQQRIVVLGAGSAGMGVSTMMAQGMVKHVSSTLMPP